MIIRSRVVDEEIEMQLQYTYEKGHVLYKMNYW